MRDPLSRRDLARVRWHIRILMQHGTDAREIEHVTVAREVIAVYVSGRTIVTHSVPGTGRGRVAAWPLSDMVGFLVLGVLGTPASGVAPDEIPGAIPVTVLLSCNAYRTTFLLLDDLEAPT